MVDRNILERRNGSFFLFREGKLLNKQKIAAFYRGRFASHVYEWFHLICKRIGTHELETRTYHALWGICVKLR